MTNKINLSITTLLIVLFSFNFCFAQNPIIQTNYTADAASLVYEDRFYIFAGRDEGAETGGWFNMKEWRIYSSVDMVNWTDHGAKLTPLDFEWSNGDAWASHCIHHNGKFYWYVSANHKTVGGKAIGVAVSDHPLGPYSDPLGTAIITNDMTPNQGDFDDIDPAVFVDDDGQAYMYWGNGNCRYVKLNEDMISFSGDIHDVDIPIFGEAPWLHKYNGVYYLTYSSGHPSTIEYCTGNSATGPWTYGGRILKPVENCGTSHQAITEFKNRWYFVYHDGSLPKGGNHRRSVRIEEFTYNTDGSIPKLTATSEGIQTAVSALNPYQRVEAETIAWAEGVTTLDSETASIAITAISNNDYIKVRNVDFGAKGAAAFTACAATDGNGGTIELRTDALDGTLIGTLRIGYTGGLGKWALKTINVDGVTGVHDLYLVFKGSESDDNLFNLDYWQFSEKKNESSELIAINAAADNYRIDKTEGSNTAVLSVTAVYADGASADITSQAEYTLSQSGIVEIANGIVTGIVYGETDITVNYNGQADAIKIIVANPNIKILPLSVEGGFNPSFWGIGTFDETTLELTTDIFGFGCWHYENGTDLSAYRYLIVELAEQQNCGADLRIFDENNYWAASATYPLGSELKLAVDLTDMAKTVDNVAVKCDPSHIYIIGFWSYGGSPTKFNRVYLSNDRDNPSSNNFVSMIYDENKLVDVYTITGLRIRTKKEYQHAVKGLAPGIYIVDGKKVAVAH